MIFKLIESENSLSGKKLHGDLPFKSLITAFTNKQGISYDSDAAEVFAKDKKALIDFRAEIDKGTPATEALKLHLSGASDKATNFAKGLAIVGDKLQLTDNNISDFITKQQMSEVSLMATNKSLINCSSLLNEYNSGCKNVGLTQQQFIESVGSSNNAMGKYLAGLNGAQASFGGYAKALVGAKLQTIGLQAASMALNAVIGMGIGLAISAAIKGIDYLIHRTDNLIQKGEDAANTIKSIRNVWNIRQK